MKDFRRNKQQMLRALRAYSEEKFTDMTPEKMFIVSINYAVMLQALHDVHYGSIEEQKDALEYFKSDVFESSCAAVAIPKALMLYIVENPDKYLDSIADYDQPDFEEDYL